MTYAAPSTNCATLVSSDPNSRFALTAAEDGVAFDIDDDGDRDRVAWTEPGTEVAFLALDRDADRQITSGRELIGDHTLHAFTVGTAALAQLAGDPGGAIRSDHTLFARMLLWRDSNHNGISESRELQPAAGELSAIGLGYEPHRRLDSHGNQSRFRGWVHLRTAAGTNGPRTADEDRTRTRYMYEVCLVVR